MERVTQYCAIANKPIVKNVCRSSIWWSSMGVSAIGMCWLWFLIRYMRVIACIRIRFREGIPALAGMCEANPGANLKNKE